MSINKKKKIIYISIFLLILSLLCLNSLFLNQTIEKIFIKDKFIKITSALETKIMEHQSLIYCETFQLAWNKFYHILNEPIILNNPPDYVNFLNKNIKNLSILKDSEYVAQFGFIKDGIVNKINDELIQKFRIGTALSESTLPPNGIILYACLSKTFEFRLNFENIEEPFTFKSANGNLSSIASFGLKKNTSTDSKKIYQRKLKNNQVDVCYYDEKQGFIIKLYSKTNGEVLTISTVPPLETLEKTYHQIKSLCKNSYKRFILVEDTLQIPKIDFKLSHSFDELLDKCVLNEKLVKKNYFIAKATQFINFSLNEKGEKSESMGEVDKRSDDSIPISHDYIVNGPFIIYLTDIFNDESDLEEPPYFMMYIGNDDLLVKK